MIKGLQKTTLIDYPGKVACTIFFAGCSFRCGYCYNAALVFNSSTLKEIKEEEIIDFLKQKKKWLDGVVIGGGEPTINRELSSLLKKIKGLDFLVKLDTNGSKPGVLRDLIKAGLVDYVAMDIKTVLEKEKYKEATGVFDDAEKIKESIKLLMENKVDYEFRTTVVPGIHEKKDIVEIAKQIKGAKKYVLQGFVKEGKLIDKKFEKAMPYSKEELGEMVKECNKFVPTELRE